MRKKMTAALLVLALALNLSGCSLAGFWLSGCGGEEADLVVINDSTAVIYSISVTGEGQTQVVSNADGRGMLERGESYGLELQEPVGSVTVVLSGFGERELARRCVDLKGERVFLTLEEGGRISSGKQEEQG